MSRSALPPVPRVIGTPAKYDATTFARTWPERHVAYVVPDHPEPLVRSYALGPDDDDFIPRNALVLARIASAQPTWDLNVTYALGFDMNSDGTQATDDIMEESGETTPKTGKPAMHKVGETIRPAQHSIRVEIRTDLNREVPWRFIGHWLNGGWSGLGLLLAGPFGKRLTGNGHCGWNDLLRAVKNAESETNMRREAEGRQQLSLFGDEGALL